MSKSQLITKIAQSVATMEGYWVGGSLAHKNNNPGNIRQWDKTPSNKGFARFATAEAGWKALYTQIENNIFGRGKRDPFPLRAINGLSLREFFGGQRDDKGVVLVGGYPGYAPAADHNDPDHYAKFVAKQAAIESIDLKLKDLITV